MTITYSPTVPIAGDTVTLAMTTGSGVTVRQPEYVVSAAPPGSSFSTGDVLVDEDGEAVLTFVPDVAGQFDISGFRYITRNPPVSYDGAAVGSAEKVLAEVQTVSVHVAEDLDFPIRLTFGGHGATIRARVQNATVTAASLVNPLTDLSRLAAFDSTVAAAITALTTTAGGWEGTIEARVDALCDAYEAHRVLTAGSVHASGDTTNSLDVRSSNHETTAFGRLNDLRTKLVGHMRGREIHGSGTWHSADDTLHAPVVAPARSMAEAWALYADLAFNVYENHRAYLTPHGGIDSTNTADAAGLLSVAIYEFIQFVMDPTAPARSPAGAITIQDRFGFTV